MNLSHKFQYTNANGRQEMIFIIAVLMNNYRLFSCHSSYTISSFSGSAFNLSFTLSVYPTLEETYKGNYQKITKYYRVDFQCIILWGAWVISFWLMKVQCYQILCPKLSFYLNWYFRIHPLKRYLRYSWQSSQDYHKGVKVYIDCMKESNTSFTTREARG